VTGSHDKTIKLWDVNKGKSVHTIAAHGQGVWCVSYNKQGSQVVSASPEGLAKVWDANTGKHVLDLKGHKKRVSILFD
jgi:WD40 repeat protein